MKTMTILCAATAAGALVGASSPASACPRSNIVGTWTDSLGSTAIFTNTKGGTATAPAVICTKTYIVKVDKLNSKEGVFTGKVSGCPTAKATLKYEAGSCTVATGPLVIKGQGKIQDTWTKQSGAVERRHPAQSDDLSSGLK
ncbi:MAG TPA: hypothetical protein VMB71_05205 [Acetobacteraceae bacterium]|nr:hypothetical protein [Acetobacteraceae bacterium]